MKKITLFSILLISCFGFSQDLLLNGGLEITTSPNGQATGLLPTTGIWSTSSTLSSRPGINIGASNAHAGNNFMNLPNDFMSFRQSFTAVSGTVYTLTFWNRFVGATKPTSNDGIFVSIRDAAGANFSPILQMYVTPTSSGDGWNKYSYTFTAPNASLMLLVSKQSRSPNTNPNNATRMDDFSIVPSLVWNGSANSDWTNTSNWTGGVVPSVTSNVFIPSGTSNQPSINSDLTINSLTIASGATLNVGTSFVTISAALNVATGGTLNLAVQGNIIQQNGATNNSGVISVTRTSSLLNRLDYTIWSSPTTNSSKFLKTFSPLTLDNRFYSYNEVTNVYDAIAAPATTVFSAGTGYLIRMPDTDAGYPAAINFNGEFSGLPNNGNISKAVTYTGAANGYNMIGNPYPSTIDANTFIFDNTLNIESTLYFWRKSNAAIGSGYATWNRTGSVGTASGAGSDVPNGTIQIGQGFFVKTKSGATNVLFNNAMRLGTASTQFLRNQTVEKSRFWLNLTNTSGAFSQMLVGYVADATQGIDDFDGKYINDSPIALTSIINNDEFTIQGRSLPFANTDVVALGFKTDTAGSYTIAIDHFDGLFASGQNIFLLDSLTGIQTNLSNSSYTFTAAAGLANSRFSIVFQSTLNVGSLEFDDNNVTVYKNNENLIVNSGNTKMKAIKIFDIQGRLIAEQKNINASVTSFENLRANQQVLIVQITSENEIIVNKKVIN